MDRSPGIAGRRRDFRAGDRSGVRESSVPFVASLPRVAVERDRAPVAGGLLVRRLA